MLKPLCSLRKPALLLFYFAESIRETKLTISVTRRIDHRRMFPACVSRSLSAVWAKACPLSALVDHFIFSNLKYVFKDRLYKQWHDNDLVVPATRHVSLTPRPVAA